MMKFILLTLFAVAALPACSRTPVYQAAPSDGAAVRIPLERLRENVPLFYTYHTDDRKAINYFVVMDNGTVSAYFDACARCYPNKLGYRQEKGRVICRTCNIGYAHSDLKVGVGSCYPISLEGAVDGSFFVIRKEDILKGARYF